MAVTYCQAAVQLQQAYESTVVRFEQGQIEGVTMSSTFDRAFPFITSPPTNFLYIAPIYVCGVPTRSCVLTLPTDPLVSALLNTVNIPQVGLLQRRYVPDIQPPPVLEYCPLGFENGRGFDLDVNETLLYGMQSQAEPQSFRICNHHRLGVTPFNFADDQGIYTTGYYVKVWAPGARNVYLTGSFNQRPATTDADTCVGHKPDTVWVHPRDTVAQPAQTFDTNAGQVDVECAAGVSFNSTGAQNLVPCNRQMRLMRAPITPSELEALLADPPVDHPYPYSDAELIQLREAMFETDVYHLVMISHGLGEGPALPWQVDTAYQIVIERDVASTEWSQTVLADLAATTQQVAAEALAFCGAALTAGNASEHAMATVAQQIYSNNDTATPIQGGCLCSALLPNATASGVDLSTLLDTVNTDYTALLAMSAQTNSTAIGIQLDQTVSCLLGAAGIFAPDSRPFNRTVMLSEAATCRVQALAAYLNATAKLGTTHAEDVLTTWIDDVQALLVEAIHLVNVSAVTGGTFTSNQDLYNTINTAATDIAAQLDALGAGFVLAEDIDALRVAAVVPEAAGACMSRSSIRDVLLVGAGLAAAKLNGTIQAVASTFDGAAAAFTFNEYWTALLARQQQTRPYTADNLLTSDLAWLSAQASKVATEAAIAATNASLDNPDTMLLNAIAVQSGLRGLLLLTENVEYIAANFAIDGVVDSVLGIATMGGTLEPDTSDAADLLNALYDLTCDASDTTPLTSCGNVALDWAEHGQEVVGLSKWTALQIGVRKAVVAGYDASQTLAALKTVADDIQGNLTLSKALLCSNSSCTTERDIAAVQVEEEEAEFDTGLCWIGLLYEALATEVQDVYNTSRHRFFSQNPDVYATGVRLGQVYPYDTTTDVINPWYTIARANMPLQNFGILSPLPVYSVGFTTWADGEPSFVVASKADQVVLRIDVRTFTPAGTLVAAATRLSALFSASNASDCDPNFVQFNTVQLLALYSAVAPYPFALDPAIGTMANLQAFVNVCHALGIGVLVETREKQLVLTEQSIFYQFDLITNTVDLARSPNASHASLPAGGDFTYLEDASAATGTGNFTLDLFIQPHVLEVVTNLHDQFLLEAHADGVVHQIFTDEPTCSTTCVATPPQTVVETTPGCNTTMCSVVQPPVYCNLTAGVLGITVMTHYLPAVYLFQTLPAQGIIVALSGALPCCVRNAERTLYPLGFPSFQYYTSTGVDLFACDPVTGGVSPGFDCSVQQRAVNPLNSNQTATFIHAHFLRYPDPDAYEWSMPPPFPTGFDLNLPATSSSLNTLALLYGASTTLPAQFRLPHWQGLFIRTRLLSGNTPVFIQGFELLNTGVVTSAIGGGLGTFLAGSVCSVVALRTSHPTFFNVATNRQTLTVGWHMFNNQSLNLLDTLMEDSFPEPGTLLDWVVFAPPGTCEQLQPNSECVLANVTGDGTSSRFVCPACVESGISDYIDVPFDPLGTADHVHALINQHPNNSITITLPLPIDSTVVVLVGGASQCQQFYADDDLSHQTPWTEKLNASVVKDLFVRCLLPPTSVLVFKAVFGPGLPDPAQVLSVTDANGLYGLAKLDAGFVGWNPATMTPLWLEHCAQPPANETCSTAQRVTTDVSVVVEVAPLHSNSPWEAVICGLPYKSSPLADVPCGDRRLGATYFDLGLQSDNDTRGLFLQTYAPVSHMTVEGTFVQHVQVQFIRLLRSPLHKSFATVTACDGTTSQQEVLEECPTGGEQIQWLKPDLVFDMDVDGDYWVTYLRVGADLLADIDPVLQAQVRLEYRYVLHVNDTQGVDYVLYRVDPYSRAIDSLTQVVGNNISNPDPNTWALNTTSTVLTTILDPPLAAKFYETFDMRVADRLLVDIQRAAFYDSDKQHREFYEVTPQLTLEINASDAADVARAHKYASSSNAYTLLKRGQSDNLCATDIQLSGLFNGGYSDLPGSTFLPFAPLAELHGIRRSETGEAQQLGVANSTSSNKNEVWLLTQPFGFGPDCIATQECSANPLVPSDCGAGSFNDTAADLYTPTWGVVPCCAWDRALYDVRREGYVSSQQSGLEEYIHEAHLGGFRVGAEVQLDHVSVHAPLYRYFAADQTPTLNPQSPPGEYFYSAGPTHAAEAFWFTNSGCPSGDCEHNPRFNLDSSLVRQMQLDKVEMLVRHYRFDSLTLNTQYLLTTDDGVALSGAVSMATTACQLIQSYGAECIVSDKALQAVVNADLGFDAEFAEAAVDGSNLWDLKGEDDETAVVPPRLLGTETSWLTVNASETMAELYPDTAFAKLGLAFVALGIPSLKQGQEFNASTGSLLPKYDPLHILTGSQVFPAADMSANNVGAPTTAAQLKFQASVQNLCCQIYADGAGGLGGSFLDVYQNCSCYTAVRKWHNTSAVVGNNVEYILENQCDAWEVLSFYLDPDDRRSIFELVFAYPNNTAAAHNCSQLINGTRVVWPFIINCYAGPGAVLVYKSAVSVSPVSFAENDQLIKPIGLNGRQLIPSPCASAFPVPAIASSTGVATLPAASSSVLTWWEILLIVLGSAIFLSVVLYYLCIVRGWSKQLCPRTAGPTNAPFGGGSSGGYQAVPMKRLNAAGGGGDDDDEKDLDDLIETSLRSRNALLSSSSSQTEL